MKKIAAFLFVFVSESLIIISGQAIADTLKTEPKGSPLSLELSYSPHYAFSFSPTTLSRQFRDFWIGASGRLVYKADSERSSISIGITYRRKKIAQSNSDNYDLATMLEFPIQINYHLKKTVYKFDPYLKTSLRVCQFKVNYFGQTDDAVLSPPNYIDYLVLADIGCGSAMKINNNCNFFLETSLGYGFTDVLPNRAYLDILLGLKLKL